jgi:vitamin B12 transporter
MGWGAEKVSVTASLFANRAANHFLYSDYYDISRRRENNEVYDTGLSASLIRDIDDLTKLIIRGDVYYGDKNIPGVETSVNTGKQKDFITRESLILDMPRFFNDAVEADISLSHRFQSLDYSDAASDSLHNLQVVDAIGRWSWYPLNVLTVSTGGSFRFSYLDSTNTGILHDGDGGLNLSLEYKPLETVLIIPSVKMAAGGNTAVPIPKLGLLWQAADFLSIKNNYYRSFKFPTFNDRYWSGDAAAHGNPDLKPEDGWGADIGAQFTLEGLNIETTFYSAYIQDSIHWRSVNQALTPVNIGEACFFGLDSSIGWELPFSVFADKKPALSLSHHFLLSYILTEGRGLDADIRMPYMPVHTFGASLEIPWNSGSLLVSAHYEGPRYSGYTQTMNTGELESYCLLNVTVNQKLNKTVSAFAVLRNALNWYYESVADYPMPGINLTLGMKVSTE